MSKIAARGMKADNTGKMSEVDKAYIAVSSS
jgi:hypothetical protein